MLMSAIFRCDASPSIGAGHVTRCMALAEALADFHWRIAFVVGPETLPTVPALAASDFNVRVLREQGGGIEAFEEVADPGADLLVVDHYGRDAAFETACRPFARKILVFDDATRRRHDCDLLIDAAAADPALYATHVPPHAHLLIGPSFALLRKSFIARRTEAMERRDGRAVREILVTCGATDPGNLTSAVLDALEDVANDVAVTIALSSCAPHLEAIRVRQRENRRLVLDSDDIAGLMTKADLAIGAAGATAWERCYLGLPSVLVTSADNQCGIARLMTAFGPPVKFGESDGDFRSHLRDQVERLLADGKARTRLAQAASVLIDGRGALRIIIDLLGEAIGRDKRPIKLRLAEAADEDWLLHLQRTPSARRYSRNPAVPTVAEHHCWMRRTLADPGKLLMLIEADGAKAGTVRLDRLQDLGGASHYEISIAIDPNFHNRGIATAALQLLRNLTDGAVLDAVVLPDNQASKALFTRAGFVPVGSRLYRTCPSSQPQVPVRNEW
jgi:UDP-2,4-diacetamido-2,4,6-trideoxy-beta-L-altropyranose hydrolase